MFYRTFSRPISIGIIFVASVVKMLVLKCWWNSHCESNIRLETFLQDHYRAKIDPTTSACRKSYSIWHAKPLIFPSTTCGRSSGTKSDFCNFNSIPWARILETFITTIRISSSCRGNQIISDSDQETASKNRGKVLTR